MKYGLVSILFLFACSTAPPAETGEAAAGASPAEASREKERIETSEETGIKNAQNVPSMTRKELQEAYKRQNECIEKCTMSRQMEAVGHEVIEQECSKTCMEKHFVGQVAVTPDVEELEAVQPADSKELPSP